MELKLHNVAGAETGAIEVAEATFAQPYNEALVHQVVVAYMAGARAGTRAQKTRAEVRGGGAKPFRQKGTGRARAGTIRSPLWRPGGKIFAARPQDHSQKVNRKMYRGALCVILSELVRQGRLNVVQEFSVPEPKTKLLSTKLKEMGLSRTLIVTDTLDETLYLAARNLQTVGLCDVASADPVSLVGYDHVIVTVGAVRQFEEALA